MIFFGLAVPRKTMSPKDFFDHWLNRHGPLVTQTHGVSRHMLRYVQYHAVIPNAGFFGVGEVCFASAVDADKAFSEPDYHAIIRPDEERFSALDDCRFTTSADDKAVSAKIPDQALVLFRFLRCKEGVSSANFEAALADVDVEVGVSRRCWLTSTQRGDPMQTGSESTLDYDAVELLWTERSAGEGGEESLRLAAQRGVVRQANLIDHGKSLELLTSAHVMLSAGAA